MPDIAWFEDIDREMLPGVGGKAANLGEMTRAGLPVPPGFVVTTDAFRSFLGADGLRGRIRERLKRLDGQCCGAGQGCCNGACCTGVCCANACCVDCCGFHSTCCSHSCNFDICN